MTASSSINSNFFKFILQDWNANTGNTKGRVILFLFRIANFCSTKRRFFYIGLPYILIYRILVEWVLGIEIPWNTKIGISLRLFHGQALVVNSQTVIGDFCTLRQSTTIGNKELADGSMSGSPRIGNHVDIGSNACIVGPITISDHVKIGCGAVVIKDVSPFCSVTGNPGIERKWSTISQL